MDKHNLHETDNILDDIKLKSKMYMLPLNTSLCMTLFKIVQKTKKFKGIIKL